MISRRVLLVFVVAFALIIIYLPGFSKLQELRQKNRELEQEIAKTRQKNIALQEEKQRLENDLSSLEAVAREKMGVVRKGEIIYKIVPEGTDEHR